MTEEHITVLFSKDPETWSASDLRRVVTHFREARMQGLFGKVDPKTGELKPKKPRKRKAVDPKQIDLEDLL